MILQLTLLICSRNQNNCVEIAGPIVGNASAFIGGCGNLHDVLDNYGIDNLRSILG